MDSFEKASVGVGCLSLLMFLGYFAVVIGGIAVIWHFVAKFW